MSVATMMLRRTILAPVTNDLLELDKQQARDASSKLGYHAAMSGVDNEAELMV